MRTKTHGLHRRGKQNLQSMTPPIVHNKRYGRPTFVRRPRLHYPIHAPRCRNVTITPVHWTPHASRPLPSRSAKSPRPWPRALTLRLGNVLTPHVAATPPRPRPTPTTPAPSARESWWQSPIHQRFRTTDLSSTKHATQGLSSQEYRECPPKQS